MKGLDGFKDPEWSMLFNSIIHVEPYHRLYEPTALHSDLWLEQSKVSESTGVAWLSSIHVVRRLVKSANECKPYI